MSIDLRAVIDTGHVLTTGTCLDEEIYVHRHPTGVHLEVVEAAGEAGHRTASATLRTQRQAMELVAAITALATDLPADLPPSDTFTGLLTGLPSLHAGVTR